MAVGSLWFVFANFNSVSFPKEFIVRVGISFQASVMRGSIPAELVKEAKGGEVHVDMEDHRSAWENGKLFRAL